MSRLQILLICLIVLLLSVVVNLLLNTYVMQDLITKESWRFQGPQGPPGPVGPVVGLPGVSEGGSMGFRGQQGPPGPAGQYPTPPASTLLFNNEVVNIPGGEPYSGKPGQYKKAETALRVELKAGDRLMALLTVGQASVGVACSIGSYAPRIIFGGAHINDDGSWGGNFYGFNIMNPIQLDVIAPADGSYAIVLTNSSGSSQKVTVYARRYLAIPIWGQ